MRVLVGKVGTFLSHFAGLHNTWSRRYQTQSVLFGRVELENANTECGQSS